MEKKRRLFSYFILRETIQVYAQSLYIMYQPLFSLFSPTNINCLLPVTVKLHIMMMSRCNVNELKGWLPDHQATVAQSLHSLSLKMDGVFSPRCQRLQFQVVAFQSSVAGRWHTEVSVITRHSCRGADKWCRRRASMQHLNASVFSPVMSSTECLLFQFCELDKVTEGKSLPRCTQKLPRMSRN